MTYFQYAIASAVLIVSLIISVVAQIKVQSAYSKYSKVESKCGLTGGELAQKIVDAAGLNVRVNTINGNLTDNYNSLDKTLNISRANYNNASVAALGVVAHECGHALQDVKNYAPLKIRQFVVRVSNNISRFLLPLLIVGLLFNFMYIGGVTGQVFIWIAVGFYALSVLANLATLPVEINASNRALKMLQGFEIMDDGELEGAREVLSAAAFTYLASLLVSFAFLLRFLLIALSSVNRR